jgi:hypothetical protein
VSISGAEAACQGDVGLPVVVFIAVSAAATVGWAMIASHTTGQPARIGDTCRFGVTQLTRLWPWSVAALMLFHAGMAACVIPDITC